MLRVCYPNPNLHALLHAGRLFTRPPLARSTTRSWAGAAALRISCAQSCYRLETRCLPQDAHPAVLLRRGVQRGAGQGRPRATRRTAQGGGHLRRVPGCASLSCLIVISDSRIMKTHLHSRQFPTQGAKSCSRDLSSCKAFLMQCVSHPPQEMGPPLCLSAELRRAFAGGPEGWPGWSFCRRCLAQKPWPSSELRQGTRESMAS